jgi:hypothetical protein
MSGIRGAQAAPQLPLNDVENVAQKGSNLRLKYTKWSRVQDSFRAKIAVGKDAGNSLFPCNSNRLKSAIYLGTMNPVSPTIFLYYCAVSPL